jgi:hypothetical protein
VKDQRRRRVLFSQHLAVFDNFLKPDACRKVFAYCNEVRYQSVHEAGVQKVWRLHDGAPVEGPPSIYGFVKSEGRRKPAARSSPTGVDLLIEAIQEVGPQVTSIIGRAGKDWKHVTATPWIYPVGSALSLHRDGRIYSGAYAYFAHPKWELYWGGWLIALDPATRIAREGRSAEFWLRGEQENAAIANPGLGTVVLPKPNRIVFIHPACNHLISRVDPNAGTHARVSIAGFFGKKAMPAK